MASVNAGPAGWWGSRGQATAIGTGVEMIESYANDCTNSPISASGLAILGCPAFVDSG